MPGGGVRVNVTTPSWLTATTLTAASSIAATSVSELKTLGRANIFPALPPAREHDPKQTHTSIHQRCVGVREEEETGKKRKKSDHLLPPLQVGGGHQASAVEAEPRNSGNI